MGASIPLDLIAKAQAVFRQRDADFQFTEWPIEVRVSDSRSILCRGARTVEEYEVIVLRGFLDVVPGIDACAAIYHRRECPDVPAHASAMLMGAPDALSICPWT